MSKPLPENPTGFTRHLVCHMSMSDKTGRYGTATYEIHDADKNKVPILTGYNSHAKNGWRGFWIAGKDEVLYPTWRDAVRAYNETLLPKEQP